MPAHISDAAKMTWLNATGITTITSGFAEIVGFAFLGTGTGSVQIFAGLTASVSMTPVITFCATSSAVAGGFSPIFVRLPAAVSGAGFTVQVPGTLDPNVMLFWNPMGSS